MNQKIQIFIPTLIAGGMFFIAWAIHPNFQGYWLAWVTMAVIILVAMWHSMTVFRHRDYASLRFLNFLLLTCFVVFYFAALAKDIGFVNTATGQVLQGESASWLNSFYFSVVTWTTVGYGDYRPTETLKPFVMAQALIGYVFMSLLVGQVMYLAQSKAK